MTTGATTPWNTARRIVTRTVGRHRPVPLGEPWAPNQQDSLAPGNLRRGQLVVDFLRGSRQKEGDKVNQLRVRTRPLGDIVDSSPVYIGPPSAPYSTQRPGLFDLHGRSRHVLRDSMSAPTTACCTSSMTPPATRSGPTSPPRCSVAQRTALPPATNDPRTGSARWRIRTARCRPSATISTST